MKTPLIAAVLAGGLVTAQAQQFSGSSTTTGPIARAGDITVTGDVNVLGRVNIGFVPAATTARLGSPQLQFSNALNNRKAVLYDDSPAAPNDNQFYGLGINPAALRFQVPSAFADFRFFRGENATTSAELFTITGAGNVGIGIANPTAPLQFANFPLRNRQVVLFDASGTGNDQFYGLGINPGALRFQVPATNTSFRFFRGDDNGTTSTEVFTITGEGRVGVGTPSPLNKLQVEGGSFGQVSQGPVQAANSRFTAIGDPPGAFPTGLGRFYGTFQKSSLQSLFIGLSSSPVINPNPTTEPDPSVKRDAVIGFQDQTSTDPNVGNRLRIGFISGVASTARFNERITVLANGFTGFGVTDPKYRVELPNIPTEAGQIRANAFVTYGFLPKGNSSARPLTGATAKLAALRSVEWQQPNGQRALGFVPAEVAQAVPEAVVLAADGTTVEGLNDAAFTPWLLQAVQELTQRLAEKDQALLALEARLTKLEGAAPTPGTDARMAPAAGQPEGTLQQNRPNPFSEATTIDFALPATATQAALLVYDEQGKLVKSLPIANAQQRSVTLSAGALPAGVYSYKIMVDGKVVGAKKMVLTR